jgi:hypothetical protein
MYLLAMLKLYFIAKVPIFLFFIAILNEICHCWPSLTGQAPEPPTNARHIIRYLPTSCRTYAGRLTKKAPDFWSAAAKWNGFFNVSASLTRLFMFFYGKTHIPSIYHPIVQLFDCQSYIQCLMSLLYAYLMVGCVFVTASVDIWVWHSDAFVGDWQTRRPHSRTARYL